MGLGDYVCLCKYVISVPEIISFLTDLDTIKQRLQEGLMHLEITIVISVGLK